jgi:hypothetical protein
MGDGKLRRARQEGAAASGFLGLMAGRAWSPWRRRIHSWRRRAPPSPSHSPSRSHGRGDVGAHSGGGRAGLWPRLRMDMVTAWRVRWVGGHGGGGEE